MSRVSQHPGSLDIDVIRSAKGKDYVVDVNPRFGGCYQFSHKAGADLPRLLISQLTGETVQPEWYSQKSDRLYLETFALLSSDEVPDES